MKILLISDSPKRQTGFGHQIRDMHKMFTSLGHDVVFLGMHSGIQGTAIHDYMGCKVYAMQGPGDPSPHGNWHPPEKHWLQQSVLIEEPDLILIVWDLRKVAALCRDFDRFFRCPTYLYWLFDSDPISHQYLELMKNTRINILPITQCIKRWLIDAEITMGWEPIPEPVDLAKFYPLPNETRERLRIATLGERADKVCFGFVGGNFQRKNIPLLIDAFAALPDEIRNDSVLFLHTDPTAHQREMSSFDLHGIINAYHSDIKDQIIFSHSNNDLGFNMCEIYNVMDWFVSGATGEGWGLALTESMACGVPGIMGDISTSEEIMGEVGFRVPIGGFLYTPNPYLRVTVPDFDTFVEAMKQAHQMSRAASLNQAIPSSFPEWDIRHKTMSDSNWLVEKTDCVERAKIFSLENVTEMWKEFFEFRRETSYGWDDKLINEAIVIQSAQEESNV